MKEADHLRILRREMIEAFHHYSVKPLYSERDAFWEAYLRTREAYLKAKAEHQGAKYEPLKQKFGFQIYEA